MWHSIEQLTKHNIKVFTIKTDALTIRNEDLFLAQELLDFEPGIGKWRHSKTGKDIMFPTKPFEKKVNSLIKLPKQTIINHPLTIQEEYHTE